MGFKFTLDTKDMMAKLKKDAIASLQKQVKAKVANLTCAEHHEHATVTLSGDIGNMKIR